MKFQIQIEVDGKPEFAIGFWQDTEDAVKWMDRFDDFFADLERDLAKENERIENGFNVVEVDTVVVPADGKGIVNRKELWEAQVAE
jgi:hypothetical protein